MFIRRTKELTPELLGKHGHYGKNANSGSISHCNAACTYVTSAKTRETLDIRSSGFASRLDICEGFAEIVGPEGQGFHSGMPPDCFPHDLPGPSGEAHS